ncbi:MAG: response regulator transcription factor [Patescibacteria group bacterium]|jgi:DNA-binding response OmpR family regulator|nr:response regulator transcription factor [Patescibacteria group bacterium]
MKVLVVEDEKQISNFIKKSLEKEHFIVDVAMNGEDGSFKARTNNYDIILLDNVMPKKPGQQVCREIRNDGRSVPILMVSVNSETTTKVDLLNSGADDYLTKPFEVSELLARINALLRRPEKVENEIINIDDLTIDIARHEVSRGDKKITLTKKEYMLLKYLVKNAGIVLSRNMLLENVWDMSVDYFSNTIESHIASLRKKIDVKGKKKLIYTVAGIGYKIDLK